MNFLLRIHIAFSLLGAGVVCTFFGEMAGLAVAAGAGVSFLNLVALVYSWPRILHKKQVAPGIATIVFKFLILGWILYAAVFTAHLSIGWLGLGIALVFPSLITSSFVSERKAV